MAVGFEVTDDYGRKQVIDTAPLLTYKDKKVIDGTPANRYVTDKYLMAAKPSEGNSLVLTKFASSSEIDPIDNERYIYRTVGNGEFIRFDYGVAPTSVVRYGLEVYNDNGVLMFSSNQKALKILDIITITDIREAQYDAGGRRTYWQNNYPNKQVAVITMQYPIWAENPHIMTVGAVKRGDTIALEAVIEWTDSMLVGGLIASYGASYMIVDVTGF